MGRDGLESGLDRTTGLSYEAALLAEGGRPFRGRFREPFKRKASSMDRTALRQVLKELVESNTGEPVERFEDDTDLRDGLGLDSVDVVSLAMEIQDQFRLSIAVADFEHLHCVGDLLDLLQTRMAALPRAA
jgi:acyl carrier protein